MSTPGANTVLSWVSELAELEDQIEALQEAKRDFYAAIREEHGKPVASGLKAALRIHRMDSEKRAAADQIDTEAARILAIIEAGDHAPRATHVENIEKNTRSATFGGSGGEPSIPSSEADGAKMEGRANAAPDRAAQAESANVNSKQAATDFEPPAFLQKKVVLRPHCLEPDLCRSGTPGHCHHCKLAMNEGEGA